MVQGYQPARGHRHVRQLGWNIAQPTHVQAAFTPDMVQGSKPEKNRERLQLRVGWQQFPFDLQQFDSAMVQGWHPDEPRLFFAPRGIPLADTAHTPVQAPFTVDMIEGSRPDQSRAWLPLRLGWSSAQTTFLVQMTPDMFAGHHLDTPRLFLAPRIPLPTSQLTHVAAPFTPDMAEGSQPDRSREFNRPKLGWSDAQLTFQVQMTPEMWTGSRPDSPRLWLAPKIPLPQSQPTHVQAAFTPDMAEGQRLDSPRLARVFNPGWASSQTTFLVQMTPEMFAGSRPDTHRIRLAPKIPLPQSQTTHVPAPFGYEMVRGSQPPTHRIGRIGRQLLGTAISILEFIGLTAVADAVIRVRAKAGIIERQADPGTVRVRPPKSNIEG
jgi:hypothetical protein